MDISNPLNAISDNPDNVFEKAKSAVGNIASDALQSSFGKEALKVLEKPLSLVAKAAVPYRDYVAPGLTAFLMEANSSYRAQHQDLSASEQFQHALDLAKQGVHGESDWRRSISPGRALVGLMGNLTPGTQETDKINWEDSKQVNDLFTSGSAQFFSGLADVGFNILDPVASLGKGYKLAKREIFTRDIGTRSGNISALAHETKLAAADPTVKNGISPFFDLVEKDPADVTTISRYGFVAGSSNPTRLATAISEAYKQGGRETVADVINASLGHIESVNRVMANHADLHQHLLANNQTTQKIESDIAKLKDVYSKNTAPTPAEEKAYIKANKDYVDQLALAEDAVALAESKLIPSQFINEFEKPVTPTWSRSNLVERLKVNSAEIQTKGMLVEVDGSKNHSFARQIGSDLKKPTSVVRTLLWLNPNTPLRETPSGIAFLGGAAGERSYLEVDARIRRMAKLTKMSIEKQKSLQTEYRTLSTKSERNNWLNNFQQDSIMGLLEKHYGKEIGRLNPTQLESANVFARELVDSTMRAQLREKKNFFNSEKQYTVVDDATGNLVSHQYMEEFIQNSAEQRAIELGNPGGTATAADVAAVRAGLGEIPVTETQVPNMHFSIDTNFFDQVMSENPRMIGNMMRGIIENNYTPGEVRGMMKDAETSAINGGTGMGATFRDVISPMARTGKDVIVEGLDTFYTYAWKPVTLMSLKYTSRNVGEGWLRIMASMLDMRSNYGYSWSDMFRGLRDPGSVSRTLQNRNYRKASRTSYDAFNKKNDEWRAAEGLISNQIGEVGSTGEKIISKLSKKSIDTMQKHEFENTDGMTMSVNWIETNFKNLARYKKHGNVKADAAVKYLNDNIATVLEPTLGHSDTDNFIRAIATGDYSTAHAISVSANSVDIARALSTYSTNIKNTLTQLTKLGDTGATTVDTAVHNIAYGLERLSLHADTTSQIIIKRGELRNELDVITAANQAQGGKKLSFTGQLEIYPGVVIDGSLAGKAEDMLRAATSSKSSSTALLANDRSITGHSFLSAGFDRGLVRRSDGAWADAHADYVNNVLMRDAVGRRIVEGIASGKSGSQATEDVKKWLADGSDEALRWKKEVKQNVVERGELIGVSSHGYSDQIELIKIQLEQYLPTMNSATGAPYTDLHRMALDGFTKKESLSINFNDRHDVMHAREVADKSFTNFYKNAVSKIFEFVGTLPEDHLVRHPFFNMVHDNEAKRITSNMVNQAKKSGMSDADIQKLVASRADAIKNTAVNRAYKELMTRLYSVERYTDPGRMLRFLTPFFMAQQNSSRFWLGSSLRNPEVAYMLSKMYNAPYRGGYVHNDKGEVVAAGHPWSKEASKQSITGLLGMEFNPTGTDIIFQGQIPILPTLGAPGGATITAELLKKAAKNDGLVSFIEDNTGMKFDDFSSQFIMPFYTRTGDRSIGGNIAASTIPINSWMISAAAAFSKGNMPIPQVKERWIARIDEARKEVIAKDFLSGNVRSRTEIQKAAVQLAQHSLVLEAASSFTGPVVAGKVKYAELEKLRNRQNALTAANGGNFNKAMIDLTTELQNKGVELAPAVLSVLNSSTSDNRYGFSSNTQTLANITKNIKSLEKADYHYSDNPFIAELFNAKTADGSYSAIADDALYSMKLNGKPLKSRNMTQAEATKLQQVRAGWATYFNYIDFINADAKAKNIDINSPAYREKYSPIKGMVQDYVIKQFPAWGTKETSISLHKSTPFISLANYFLNDKQYMSTVGNKNDAIKGLKLYMEARAVVSKEFQNNAKVTGYSTLDAAANQRYADVMVNVSEYIVSKHPEFQQMYDRYLVQDELLPIDTILTTKGT